MKKIGCILFILMFTTSSVVIMTSFTLSMVSAYTPHVPIYIDGNTAFAENATNEGWLGDGSKGNPYIIEGYDINASSAHGIEIWNTDVYFVIRDCYIHDGKPKMNDGIYFENVYYGSIENSNITNNYCGIRLSRLSSSFWNTISNNSVSSNKYGIILYKSSNNTISNNSIYSNNDQGVYLFSSSINTISNNSMSYNYLGINLLESSNSNTISDNSISNNDYGMILSQSSSSNTITNNSIYSNGWDGIYLHTSSNSNTISNNNIYSNSEYGIYLKTSSSNTIFNNSVHSNNGYGMYLYWTSKSNKISNNNISNNPRGIILSSSSSNTITNNTIYSNNKFGIFLGSSSSNAISNNSISNNRNGIYLDSSSSNTISNNDIYSNNRDGVFLDSSSNNAISNNNIYSNNYSGIYLWSSSTNTISSNSVYSNYDDGIWLNSSSNSNTIIYNNISLNTDYGINITDSNDNRIHHNNFLCNNGAPDFHDPTHSFPQAYDNGINYWNTSKEGNWWSDWTEPDNISPFGIVDDPYLLDGGGQDYYPLTTPIGISIFLFSGWNLISVPFIQFDTNVGSVLSSIDGNYDAVQWYDTNDASDPWKHNHTSKPSQLNDLENLNHTNGFWIHIIEPGGVQFYYQGTPPTSNQTIPLHPGWNMVGYPSLSNHNRTEGLNNLTFGSHVDSIWTYNAATQKWKELGPSDYFEIGRGYWVHAKVECEWEVPL